MPTPPLKLAASLAVLAATLLGGCPASPRGSAARPSSATVQPAPSVEPGTPIARIGDAVISVEGLTKRLNDQSPFVRARFASPEHKQEFLDQQVRFEVLAAEAFARGYQNDPEVQDALKKLVVQKLTREEFDSRVKLKDVTDAELQAWFDMHRSDYEKPEMVRGSHIFFAFGADKAASKKRAEDAQKRATTEAARADKNSFKALAAELSEDEATKRAGGDLRYVTADEATAQYGEPVRAFLFGERPTAGRPGAPRPLEEVSPVLEGREGWHVVTRTGTREAMARSFDQVKGQIKNLIYRDKRAAAFNALVDQLKSKHKVEVYTDKLVDVKVTPGVLPSDGAAPLGLDPSEVRGGSPEPSASHSDQP